MQRGCRDQQPPSHMVPMNLTYSSATELGKWFSFSGSVSLSLPNVYFLQNALLMLHLLGRQANFLEDSHEILPRLDSATLLA